MSDISQQWPSRYYCDDNSRTLWRWKIFQLCGRKIVLWFELKNSERRRFYISHGSSICSHYLLFCSEIRSDDNIDPISISPKTSILSRLSDYYAYGKIRWLCILWSRSIKTGWHLVVNGGVIVPTWFPRPVPTTSPGPSPGILRPLKRQSITTEWLTLKGSCNLCMTVAI